MRVLIFFFIFFFIFNILNANIKIVAKVKNETITSYELENKIRTLIFLSGQPLNQENINKLKNTAINSLINLKIKYLEVKRNKINKIDEKRLKNYLDNLSKKYGTNGRNLNKIFIQNNIDYDLFLEEITTEFKWQQFILSSYKKELMSERKNLNTEVENELKDILTKKGNLVEYELLEIEIFYNKDEEISIFLDQIKDIDFESAAKAYSVSETSKNGGYIGWVNEKSLSSDINLKLKETKVGSITSPILRQNSFLILKINNKRNVKISEKDMSQMRETIANKKIDKKFKLYSNNYLSKIKRNAYIEIK